METLIAILFALVVLAVVAWIVTLAQRGVITIMRYRSLMMPPGKMSARPRTNPASAARAQATSVW